MLTDGITFWKVINSRTGGDLFGKKGNVEILEVPNGSRLTLGDLPNTSDAGAGPGHLEPARITFIKLSD